MLFFNEPPKIPDLIEPIVIEIKVEKPKPKKKVVDPNNCEPEMYWAKESPHYCIPKETVTNTTIARKPSTAKFKHYVVRNNKGNLYSYGYCTWYVKNHRPDLPNNLGHAITWVDRAAAQGYPTGSKPRVGAVGQYGNHVVIVTAVHKNGTFTLREMNFTGWNRISSRTVSSSGWRFIYS